MSIPAYTKHEQLKHIPIRGDGDELNKKGGYTTIPHWMVDELPGLNGNQRAFLQKVARETWGRQLKSAHISIAEFMEYLDASRNTVREIRDFLVINNYIEMLSTHGGRCEKNTYSILVNGAASEPLIPKKAKEKGSAIDPLTTQKANKKGQPLTPAGSAIDPLIDEKGSAIDHAIIKKEEKNFLKKDCGAENSAPQKQPMQLAAQAASNSDELLPEKAKKTKEPKPKAEKTEQQQTNAQVWVAYRDAYQARYGIEPVRNAMVNKQISMLVSRIGADAIKVAAWFVNHRNAFYIQKGHTIGVLLADCEKLRTEWATGQQMTTKTAQQLDNTQSNLSAFDEFSRMVDAKYGSHS